MLASRLSFSALTLLFLMSSAALADELRGSWSMLRSDEAGKIRFGLVYNHKGGHTQHESDWDAGTFQGLDRSPAKHDVTFAIVRDAGRFDCTGFLANGEGAGIFTYTPNAQFSKEMAALGFVGIREEMQFAMAIHDVTLDFARQMRAEKLENFDTDKLVAFRIFDVNSQFIRELRSEGLDASDSNKLIAFRVHGVTPKMVRELRESGLKPTEDQLIAFRVHGVSPEFVRKVEAMGYENPEPDQLISMRIFGVTPEFIADLRSRGLKDLSIDKLVQLKVHGIN